MLGGSAQTLVRVPLPVAVLRLAVPGQRGAWEDLLAFVRTHPAAHKIEEHATFRTPAAAVFGAHATVCFDHERLGKRVNGALGAEHVQHRGE